MTNKLLPVALVAALIGGSVGAFVMHSNKTAAEPQTAQLTPQGTDAQYQDASNNNSIFNIIDNNIKFTNFVSPFIF